MFLSWLRAPQAEDYRRSVCDALRACTDDVTPPVVKFSGSYPAPTRDEMRVILADAENCAEQKWLELERAKERAAQQQDAPRVAQFKARTVRS
jgi:hypothetical protein